MGCIRTSTRALWTHNVGVELSVERTLFAHELLLLRQTSLERALREQIARVKLEHLLLVCSTKGGCFLNKIQIRDDSGEFQPSKSSILSSTSLIFVCSRFISVFIATTLGSPSNYKQKHHKLL